MTVTAVVPPVDLSRSRPRPIVEPVPSRLPTPGTTSTALAHAPVGQHGLAEAVLAWQHLRPRGAEAERLAEAMARGATAPAYLPIAYPENDLVATRLVRVLTGLTWAFVADGPERPWVGVARADYHRVGRALTGTWRRYRRDFTELPATAADPTAAVALWRMALLLGNATGGRAFVLHIPVRYAADMLCQAAHTLGVTAATDPCPRGRRTVTVCSAADVRRLLTLAI
ncbi:hypothetical protein GCM10023322_08250 [Rugosimonospora acidiphila]|uniref:Uncharacterized protein n=1 Tax=Rugosimonospora acidiphila TaxID=556531 RepID=A0ABP9RKN6_9ACTN